MFAALGAPGTIQMGERNSWPRGRRSTCTAWPLVGEATGGDFGRTVRLWVADGRVEVSSVAHGVQTL